MQSIRDGPFDIQGGEGCGICLKKIVYLQERKKLNKFNEVR